MNSSATWPATNFCVLKCLVVCFGQDLVQTISLARSLRVGHGDHLCLLGYVKKWNRYWFVLADAVLYYFLAPQHQDEAPRCIIPLEHVNIDPVGTTDLTISLKVRT